MRAMIIGLLVVITSSLAWADGFRPGSEPWGYKQTGGGAWYRPGTDPYPGNAPRWGGPEYRPSSGGYYRPGTDPYPGNARYGRGGSGGEVAAFVIGGLLGYYLGNRHEPAAAPQPTPTLPPSGGTIGSPQGATEICPAP